MIKSLCCIACLLIFISAIAQPYPPGKVLRISSSHSMFPDSLRNAQPRVYNGKTYSAAQHYSDSSVFIFVPDYFDQKKPMNLVFWFHGWSSNIDTSLVKFQLVEQFYASQRNAIFIFPEGPKNAPDSYGGKLETKAEFYKLGRDVLPYIPSEKVFGFSTKQAKETLFPITITLAGHSGAYRVMGKILANGSPIEEVFLFDGLYGEIEAYQSFAVKQPQKRFINIYTDNGGTKQNSLDFLLQLDSLNVPYLHKEEDALTTEDLKTNRIIFLHSKMGHNEVITNNSNFERFLKKDY